MKIATRKGMVRVGALVLILAVLSVVAYVVMIQMPGESFAGPLPEMSERERRYEREMRSDLQVLAGEIGERNVFIPGALKKAAEHIEGELVRAGLEPSLHEYEVMGDAVANIEVELKGTKRANEILVVGAHYDSVSGSAGANDNGTGTVAVMALARTFAREKIERTLRFVLFVNEEPPFFLTEQMGSFRYARRCRDRDENIVGMISLETIGHYDDTEGSQKYPAPFSLFYPSRGDFVGFVGNVGSRSLVRDSVRLFRESCQFPSEGVATYGELPGIFWSDHWSFWQHGYSGVMVTDTAPFRYAHYHKKTDLPGKIDYERLARVVAGMELVVRGLGNAGS